MSTHEPCQAVTQEQDWHKDTPSTASLAAFHVEYKQVQGFQRPYVTCNAVIEACKVEAAS